MLRETHGWSHHFQWWQGSSTGTFLEKSTRWNERSEKTTSSTASWFVDTFNGWCRTPGCQRILLELLDEEASKSRASSPDKPWYHYPEARGTTQVKPIGASVPKVLQEEDQARRSLAALLHRNLANVWRLRRRSAFNLQNTAFLSGRCPIEPATSAV